VYFDYNLLRLQSPKLASVRYEHKLMASAGRSVMFAAVVADSPQQAQEYEAKLAGLPAVARVESVARYLAGDGEQAKKLQIIRSVQSELAGIQVAPCDRSLVRIDELSATLWYLTGYLGLGAEIVQEQNPALADQLRGLRARIVQFRKTLLSGQPQIARQLSWYQQALFTELSRTIETLKHQDTSGPLRAQDLPVALRHQFIGVSGKCLLQVYPKKDLWQHANQRELIRELEEVIPPEKVTGMPVQIYHYTRLLKQSYEQAAWYSLGAIALMLLLHFRSPGSVILALLPVGIGSLWLLGFMGALGIAFNPANIMVLPLMVGIGVSSGIQILNRFAEEQHPGIFSRSTGKAVLVSGLTAMTGFGTLLLAQHQGIRSLGAVMSVGIAACMLAALILMPALLSLLMRRPRARQLLPHEAQFHLGWRSG
ncbi:MAG TPA: MMPL family transporter, partial [Candidatus Sulfotelmatobacter sp.]|nr:MMPL family transporter [Candidatus Sulfotelmatobacter sp.]